MRILIYSYNYYPEPIGIAPLMTELAEGLVQRGHEVRVVTGMPNYPQRQIYPEYQNQWYATEQRNGVTIQRSYLRVKPNPGLCDRLLLEFSFVLTSWPQALNGWRPDVILVTVPPLLVSLSSTLLGWLYNCPVVLNVQDLMLEAATGTRILNNRWLIKALAALERFAYCSADSISVISDAFTDRLLAKGVNANKISCISNWVDVNFIRPLPQLNNAFRTAHNLEGKFVVLYAGNIALTQGLETVLTTAAALRSLPNIVFVIVGETQALENLRQRCQQENLENTLLLPFQPREMLPEMLAAADVGLIVQKRNVNCFNMPSKLQTLLASGRAIVAAIPETSAAAQVLRQSGAGLVVEPESPVALSAAIIELYEHPETAVTMGQKGRQFAIEHYSFDRALTQYEALFATLTADQRAALPQFAPHESAING